MLINKSMIDARAEEAAHANFHNKKYDKLIDDTCKAQDKLKDLVPEDKHDLLYDIISELEDATRKSGAIEQREMYKQGFNDGLEIAVLLLKQKR